MFSWCIGKRAFLFLSVLFVSLDYLLVLFAYLLVVIDLNI